MTSRFNRIAAHRPKNLRYDARLVGVWVGCDAALFIKARRAAGHSGTVSTVFLRVRACG